MDIDLNKFTVFSGCLTGTIYLARKGAKETLNNKRDATAEVMEAVTEYVLHDAPKGATINYTLRGKTYEITIKPLVKEDTHAE